MMDKMVSFKRYSSNLVIANIIIASVWILLSLSVVKKLTEEMGTNSVFIMTSLAVISSANILSAYFGIIGIIRRYSSELTIYYILSRITILSETLVYLLILFVGKQSGSYHQIPNSVQTGVTLVVIITQIWLLYETKNFEDLSQMEYNEDFDIFRVRTLSSPPNICDIEKTNRVYSLTDQLLSTPAFNAYPNDRLESHHQIQSSLMNFGAQPVYQPLSTPLINEMPQSFSNHWYYPSESGPPLYKY